MPDDSYTTDSEIIRAAYAEKVKETFKIFAENLGMGQNQKNSTERFLRSLEVVRKARDLALDATSGVAIVEPTANGEETLDAERPQHGLDDLSPEDQAMVDQALAGTTGHKPMLQRR